MQPQLVMTILVGPWEENSPAAHLLQCTQNRWGLRGSEELIVEIQLRYDVKYSLKKGNFTKSSKIRCTFKVHIILSNLLLVH